MEDLFVPYKESFELQQLGFNEPCFMYYYHRNDAVLTSDNQLVKLDDSNIGYPVKLVNSIHSTKSPLYQQAFRWFREKHNLYTEINLDSYKEPYLLKITIRHLDKSNTFVDEAFYPHCKKGIDTFDNSQYQEAELACLVKLIEIVKKK